VDRLIIVYYIPNIIKLNVHSATCICSIELYSRSSGMVYFGRFFAKLEFSRGSLNTIIYAPCGPSLGLKEEILFLEIVNFFILGEQRSCDGRGARSAPFGVAMSLKRRVRAAHGRARAVKTH
jgi:hypothetical protein